MTSDAVQRDRGRVQLVDVIMGVVVLVAVLVMAPWLYEFIGMMAGEADPFSRLVLQLLVPSLLIAVVISVGVSARRGGA